MSPSPQTDLVLAWLNDAYAMEMALLPVLEKHAKDAREFGPLSKRIQGHAEQGRKHAELVKGCIERLGGRVSKIKTAIGAVTGTMQSVSTAMFPDNLIKNAIADLAAEGMEIASYTSLIAAARQIGDERTASVCERILAQEQAMAAFWEKQIPMITKRLMIEAGEDSEEEEEQPKRRGRSGRR